MSWSDWCKDSSGGKVSEKVEKSSDGSKDTHYIRTSDDTRSGSKDNHSHVMVREKADGSSTAHGFHGIRK
jgi:hypothetical protein